VQLLQVGVANNVYRLCCELLILVGGREVVSLNLLDLPQDSFQLGIWRKK